MRGSVIAVESGAHSNGEPPVQLVLIRLVWWPASPSQVNAMLCP